MSASRTIVMTSAKNHFLMEHHVSAANGAVHLTRLLCLEDFQPQ